jgi:hypothetical protein
MKNLLLIVAFSILLRPAFPLLDYAVNYDYIRKELCVNRDKIVMGCNGKCYLMKQLAAASEQDKPASTDKKHHSLEKTDLFFYCEKPSAGPSFANNFKQAFSFCDPIYSVPDAGSVFRPPIVS